MFWVSELKIMNTRVLCPRHVSETRVRHALSVEIETETGVGDNCDCGLWMIVLRGSFTVWSRGCPWSRRLTLVQPSTYWRPLLAQRNQSVRPPTTCRTTLARPRPAERGPETLYLTSWPSRGQDLTRWSRLEGSLTSPSTPRGLQIFPPPTSPPRLITALTDLELAKDITNGHWNDGAGVPIGARLPVRASVSWIFAVKNHRFMVDIW